MIKIENVETNGWEPAIRGMRNPMNSWDQSDSSFKDLGSSLHTLNDSSNFMIGPNDRTTMKKLSDGGPVHGKFKRMIKIYMDITAPLYWWKEFDTYKVGTDCNSCSTMHKIHAKKFELEDFSFEHLMSDQTISTKTYSPLSVLKVMIDILNINRELFVETKDKQYWWQMIQLLPSSYNQRRTVEINYEVATSMYRDRHNHKLDEWHGLCDVIEGLPYSELITAKPTYV